jgi:heme A synthase
VTVRRSSRLNKKHLLIAIVSLLAVGLVVACVLIGIRMVTDSQKEIVKVSHVLLTISMCCNLTER